ncbi:hypothetical protein ABZ419_11540 [Streptomyces cinnamoneus]|uniref:hypothetical protein n=1 Tax=Streptomyces cinnamoneus TaxID=53446 RepID=UPI0033DC18CF
MSGNWGDLQLSRILLRETFTVTEAGGDSRTLDTDGQESSPPLTRAQTIGCHDNINALQPGTVAAVTFTDKPERNGYYSVRSAGSTLTEYHGEVVTAAWKTSLTRLGSAAEVDLQSRLTGAVRSNDFSLSGERWHAPPIGHYGYYTGSSSPTTMTRTTTDGTMTVYRSVPASVSPRWGCAPTDYLDGRVRVNDTTAASANIELEGTDRSVPSSAWSLGNGIVNVVPSASAGVLDVQAYTGGAWRSKMWNVTVAASAVAAWDSASLLRNDPEMCILRLVASRNPGRVTLDLTLRRGSRFVEGYLQSGSSATLAVYLQTAETNNTALAASGYVTATNNDAAGNRFVAGSARTFTGHASGGVSKASTTTLDFWIGVAAGGGSAVAGDAATDLRNQYIACLPEAVYAVRR